MKFCRHCKMNVFPTRPRFNIQVFGIFVVIMLIAFIAITIVFYTILSELFLFLYFMWGFMVLNPYLIYYGLKQKNNCPRCYSTVRQKNLEYKPFGEKEPEIYEDIQPSQQSMVRWHCPYCGTLVEGDFCKNCGKKLELKM